VGGSHKCYKDNQCSDIVPHTVRSYFSLVLTAVIVNVAVFLDVMLCYVVLLANTNILNVCADSIFMVKDRKAADSYKYLYLSTELHRVTSQKTMTFISPRISLNKHQIKVF
jgi:hypothetical protein